MQSMAIKLAVPTDDGETISQHFGQAKYFNVLTLENNQVSDSEMREKASHQHGDHSSPEGAHPGQQMVESISDCQVLIVGGMWAPAFNRAAAAGLKVYLTGNTSILAAVNAYIAGNLDNNPSLMHMH
jgi:predicted Fe-Mo cluster-binding NifX family protein